MPIEYAEPRDVDSPEGLFFYHSIDLPGHGLIEGDWDLRNDARAYLGNVDFNGKRVLDMGAATGYLSFKMEELGATDVVSFDIRNGSDWDVVPHYKLKDKMDSIRRSSDSVIETMKNSYWFSHKAIGSNANAYYGNIYDVPEELGSFDVVFYGMILTHLRDPYLALYQGARLCTDTLIITGIWGNTDQPISTFRPAGDKTSNLDVKGWWLLSRGTIVSMIGTMGFEVTDLIDSHVMVNADGASGPRTCQAIVAKRVG